MNVTWECELKKLGRLKRRLAGFYVKLRKADIKVLSSRRARPMPMRSKNSRLLYSLLGLYVLVSMTYFMANMSGFIDNYFNLHQRPQTPLTFDIDTLKITSVRPEAKMAGLAKGDVLISVNDKAYAGNAHWLTLVRNQLHPGDRFQVTVRKPDGTINKADFLLTGRSKDDRPSFREWSGILLLFGLPPLVCLLIGYWVVAARPSDPLAWLVLIILTFTETFLSISNGWWGGYWDLYIQAWMQVEQTISPLALLLFGFYFPERWRLDRKVPWLKWLLLAPSVVCAMLGIWVLVDEEFFPVRNLALRSFNHWTDITLYAVDIACISLYWAAIFDKARSASTADARRRLQVLGVGSLIGLGSVLLFAMAPLFHIDNTQRWLGLLVATLSLVFPFTLAYVVVVQRAMDVRILLRMGTKYALARATISVLRTVLLIALVILLVQVVRTPTFSTPTVIKIAVIAGLLLLLRTRLTRDLSNWLDRRFFHEAYDAELLLAELSQRVRKYNDSGPILEMVIQSLVQTLHIDKIAVFLLGGNSYQLQQAVGVDWDRYAGGQPVQLPLNSTTVRNLKRTNMPITVYRENPDGWLLLASATEWGLFDALSTELLLPLSGRDQLMGLITLGPKRSEAPYTSSDLRLLGAVATQTGLALEIGELARSLAKEATQHERIQREIEVAHEVQERLFPQKFPVIEGISLAGHCRPAQGVGGDYYDLFTLEDGRIGIAIGDVSGKGISAALLMASLRASLRGMTLDAPHDLTVTMKKVNRLVYEASASNRYATFFFATYDAATRELVYVNAGHNAPFLIHQGNGRPQVQRLEAGGPVVGLLDSVTYEEQRLVLGPGDMLLAYTDGISEAMTVEDEEWGEERMLAAVQTLPDGSAQAVLEHLFAEADSFTGKAPQHDDMTVLVLKLAR